MAGAWFKLNWALVFPDYLPMKSKKQNIYYNIHLYLGLISGIIVFIIGITGCLWVFQEEFTELVDGTRKVQEENRPFITLTEAQRIAQGLFPDQTIHGTAIKHKTDPIEVIFYDAEPEFYQSVFLNPYSGEVLGVKNHREGFFWFVLRGHLYLWLPKYIGTEIMRYGTMVFVVLLITGITLWWPKNKNGRKQRLLFLWKSTTKWRRKNFDLHSIVGFYISVFALIISFSGLIMAFNWIYFATYKVWGGSNAPQFIIPENVVAGGQNRIDELYPIMLAEYPNHESLEFHYPANDSASIYVEVSHEKGVYYNSDYKFFDQYTLQEVETSSIYGTYAKANLADKVIRMNYDIHVGAIGGLAGKIIAFFVSLMVSSLPVTGLLLWWGRKNKSSKKRKGCVG